MYYYRNNAYETQESLLTTMFYDGTITVVPNDVLDVFPDKRVTVYRRGVMHVLQYIYNSYKMIGKDRPEKIEAIRAMRRLTGMGLKECKDFIESDGFLSYDPQKDNTDKL